MENDASRKIKITFKRAEYEIRTKELVNVFRTLKSGQKLELRKKENILKLFKECKLYDEDFLKVMSSLQKRAKKSKKQS